MAERRRVPGARRLDPNAGGRRPLSMMERLRSEPGAPKGTPVRDDHAQEMEVPTVPPTDWGLMGEPDGQEDEDAEG